MSAGAIHSPFCARLWYIRVRRKARDWQQFSTDDKRVSRIKFTIQIGMNKQKVVFEG